MIMEKGFKWGKKIAVYFIIWLQGLIKISIDHFGKRIYKVLNTFKRLSYNICEGSGSMHITALTKFIKKNVIPIQVVVNT